MLMFFGFRMPNPCLQTQGGELEYVFEDKSQYWADSTARLSTLLKSSGVQGVTGCCLCCR